MCEPIGAGLELGVRDVFGRIDDRNRFRRSQRLLGDLHEHRPGVVLVRGLVPLFERQPTLLRRQDLEA